jgi:hypothetical protein
MQQKINIRKEKGEEKKEKIEKLNHMKMGFEIISRGLVNP